VFAEVIVPDPGSPSGLSTVHNGVREPIVPLPQTYRANIGGEVVDVTGSPGLPPVALIVPRRGNGPIISEPAFNPETGTFTALSAQSVGFGPTRDLEGVYRINHAQDVDAFADAMRLIDFASQNFVYADVEGDIAYFSTGEIPLRADLQKFTVDGLPPFLIRDGSGFYDNEWIPDPDPAPDQATPFQILPFEEVPQVVNPPSGFIINANNDPVGTSLDNNTLNQLRPSGAGLYYLNWGGQNFSIRAGRIARMLDRALGEGDRRLSFGDMKRFQADTVLGDAEFFVPHIVQAFDNGQRAGTPARLAGLVMDPRVVEAVGRLRQWDFSTPTGLALGFDADPDADDFAASVAATVYSVWRGRMIVNTLDATLDRFAVGEVLDALDLDEMPKPGDREEEVTALRHLLDGFDLNRGVGASGVNFFHVDDVEDAEARRDIVLLQSLSDTLDLLASDAFAAAFGHSTDQDDYRWGKLHRIVFEHVLGDAVPDLNLPPPGLSPLGDALPGYPTDGGYETVDSAVHAVRAADSNGFMFAFGPSRRYAAGMKADEVRAETSLPGGVSGVLGSPFYGNMLEEWLFNETHRLNVAPDDNAGTVQEFRPAPG
jgi:penicillin amidase